MYVADERFTKNIDKFGEGLAQFMCDAMEVYANRNKIKSKTGGDFLHLFYFNHIIQSLISRIVQMRILLISRFSISRLCVYSVSFNAPD